ncbi:hypothetical protein [Paenibacillus rigui]|uniref:Uncharacterized protein n=1 Tax=Paenibacillus rigui TaxID=554312 RepID=A0A229UKD1_9BACL|nr:hypothetical protein [Paenibacillus rigui]OXM83907.1 hypothetical protein CF651_23665 [Paenibacillus rigui]
MEPIDDELKKGLESGPLTQNGFTIALRQRIEDRLDEPKHAPRKWIPWFGGIGVALLTTALFLSSDWSPIFKQESMVVLGDKTEAKVSLSRSHEQQIHIRSAVLLGLRTDHIQAGQTEYSTYRTLLLAKDQGNLQKVAEGDGILMPYKSDFMKIEPQSQRNEGEQSIVLSASQALEANKNRVSQPMTSGPFKLSEKLLFAGNRYLSVLQTIRQSDQGQEAQYEYVWVKQVQDIAKSNPRTIQDPARDPHVSLKTIYGDAVQPSLRLLNVYKPQASSKITGTASIDDIGESWTIGRKQGQWVPQLAAYSNQAANHVFGYQLRDVPITLPESVVSYDRLTTNWNDILRIRPDALDAFSSPNNEMFGIVSDKDISIFSSEGHGDSNPLLKVELQQNESVVMIQWAIDEPFIELWKEKTKKMLGY